MTSQELATTPGSLGRVGSTLPAGLSSRLEPMRAFIDQPAVKKSLPALGTLGAVAVAGMAWWTFQSPPQQTLFEGLTDADKSAVVSALQTSGINYEISRDTGAVQVDQDQVQRARIMLAGQGLPKAAPAGDAMIANLPMGSSRAVEGETLRAAHEADLSRTIEAIDNVKVARVHLATPDPSPFVRDQQAPAASVMLTMQNGRTLSEAQVRAIRQLVASSVAGLSPASVSVVDQSGALMSRENQSADDETFAMQVQAEERYRQSLSNLLIPTLGAGNFTAEVHADFDQSESQATRESYPQNDRALRSEQGNKVTTSTAAAPAVGIPGALSNQPPPASQLTATAPQQSPSPAPAAPNSDSNESYTRSFDVGREISVTHQPRGRLKRLTVAVAVNTAGRKQTPAEINSLQELVKGAVGFDAARGDVVVVTPRSFAAIEDEKPAVWDSPWFMPLLRQAGALVAALLAFLFIGRPLLKSFRNRSESSSAAAGSGNADVVNGSSIGAPVTLDMIERAPSYETRADLVRNFVRQDREKAAMVVQQLVGGQK